MKAKWYNNDWVVCILAGIVLVLMVVANYYYHKGILVW